MKILHITEVSSGGVLPIITNICNGMADEHDIYFAYAVRPDTPADIKCLFRKEIHLIKLRQLKREISFDDIKAVLEIRKYVKAIKPDIVHFHSTKAGADGRIALLFYRKIKQYYTPHGYCFLKRDDSMVKRRIYQFIEILLAHTSCRTIACGYGEYMHAMKLNKNALVVRNGIDIEKIDRILKITSYKQHEFTVYTAGRIGPQKNPKMFNEIAKKCSDIAFVWIGDGEDRRLLTSDNIMVTGFISNDKVIELSKNYDCYVSCSLWEGLPIALMEAMYLGKECVVSDSIGNHELIKKNVNGLIAHNLAEFIDSIQRCREKKQYGKIAHDTIVHLYTKDILCENLREIYISNA